MQDNLIKDKAIQALQNEIFLQENLIKESETHGVKVKGKQKIFENLICDNDRLYKLGKQGYKTWYDKFRWCKIYKKYESIYLNLLNRIQVFYIYYNSIKF